MSKILQNFAGSTRKSDLAKLSRAVTRNMFVEPRNDDYGVTTILRGMPGWSLAYTRQGTPRGVYKTTNGKVFYGSGSGLYCNGTKIFNISSGNNQLSFAETGGNRPRLLVADGVSLFAVDTTLSVVDMQSQWVNIEVPNDPWRSTEEHPVKGQPIAIAMIYEHPMLLMKNTDRIYMGYQYPFEKNWGDDDYYEGEKAIENVDINDLFMLHWKSQTNAQGTTGTESVEIFPEGKWISSDYSSDVSNSMCSSKGRLIVGGPGSIQAFSYVGGDFVRGNVFSTSEAACSNIGTYENSLADISGHYCFCGKNGVYCDGTKVSDDFIDRAITTEGFKNAGYMKWYSHILYIIRTQASVYAYDVSNDTWITLSSNNDGVTSIWRYVYCHDNYAQDSTAIVSATESSYSEHDGNPIVRGRTGTMIHSNLGREFQLDAVRIICNNGQFAGQATLSVTGNLNDTDTRTIEGGALGDYDNPLEFYDFGVARQFEVSFSTSESSTPFAIYGIEIDANDTLY